MRSLFAALAIASTSTALADTQSTLPVREITVFKDGHALLLRSGELETNEAGDVSLEELPRPIFGAFWAFENEPEADLRAVTAARFTEQSERQAQTTAELITANIGARIRWLDHTRQEREGVILDVFENEALLRMDDESVLIMSLAHLRQFAFVDRDPRDASIEFEEDHERLTLNLEWIGRAPKQAQVGFMCLEYGVRWIPSYRVTLLSDDTARIELQATLINELTDLEDVSMNLVVGVPSFAFEHTLDPMALQDTIADLGPYFTTSARTRNAMANSILSQSRGGGRGSIFQDEASHAPPAPSGTAQAEDLFVYAVDHVSLNRGERMTIPLATFEVPYEPVYTLDLPVEPPLIALQNFNTHQHRELAELLKRPVATHTLRFRNDSEYPFTTAPALILRDDHPLAQGIMTYAAVGASSDLDVTSSVDIQVDPKQEETERDPKAMEWNGHTFQRVDMRNAVTLTNYKSEPVQLEISQHVFGNVDQASHDAEITRVSLFADPDLRNASHAQWWRWWSWPWWWSRLNGASRIEWTITLEPGETADLTCDWSYYLR